MIPEHAVERVRRWADHHVEPELRDEIRIEADVEKDRLLVFECRPPWKPEFGPEWTRLKVARVDYDGRHWLLFCADSNGKWHRYTELEPTRHLDDVLDEIDEDPTAIFWG